MNVIINYGLGNLTSILSMHKRLGIEACITDDKAIINRANKLILPGVGHFDKGMQNLNRYGLTDLLSELVLVKKVPILGICLGAQLMTRNSEEGSEKGLAWLNANTIRFTLNTNELKIPHMGWSDITIKNNSEIFKDLHHEPRFYFVHSYHFLFDKPHEIIATAYYGYEFACAFQKENIFGVQFHPEKSHKFGMKILENFSTI